MEWTVLCSSCRSRPDPVSRTSFYLTSCGHFVCGECRREATEYCPQCMAAYTAVKLGNPDQMSKNVLFYFTDPVIALQKMIQAAEFQKAHREWRVILHRKHWMLTVLRDAERRQRELEVDCRRLAESISLKERRVMALRQQVERARREMPMDVEPDPKCGHPSNLAQYNRQPSTMGPSHPHSSSRLHPSTLGTSHHHPSTLGTSNHQPSPLSQSLPHLSTLGPSRPHPSTLGPSHPRSSIRLHPSTLGTPNPHPSTLGLPHPHPSTLGPSPHHPSTLGPSPHHPSTHAHPSTLGPSPVIQGRTFCQSWPPPISMQWKTNGGGVPPGREGGTNGRAGITPHRMVGVPPPGTQLRTPLSVGKERTMQTGPEAMLSTAKIV